MCGNIGTSSGSTFPDIPPLRSATISTAYKHKTDTQKKHSLCLTLHESVAEYHVARPCNTLSQSLELHVAHSVPQIVSSSLLEDSEFFPCTAPKTQLLLHLNLAFPYIYGKIISLKEPYQNKFRLNMYHLMGNAILRHRTEIVLFASKSLTVSLLSDYLGIISSARAFL